VVTFAQCLESIRIIIAQEERGLLLFILSFCHFSRTRHRLSVSFGADRISEIGGKPRDEFADPGILARMSARIAARCSTITCTIERRESVGASWINGKGTSPIIQVKVVPRCTVAPRSPQRASERASEARVPLRGFSVRSSTLQRVCLRVPVKNGIRVTMCYVG